MFGYLRFLLSHRRLPSWVEYQLTRNPSARAQRVVFTRQRFHYSRKVGNVLWMGSVFAVSWKLQPYLIKSGDDKKEEPMKQEDEDTSPHGNTVEAVRPQKIGEDQTELSSSNFPLFNGNSIFIPLGWSRPTPVIPYKGDDPEWEEFLKVNRDKQRMVDIRNELAARVLDVISARKVIRRALGEPIECSKYWLDIIFPVAPPPEYERSGLEISWNGIRWTTRPVIPYNLSRLRQAIWPSSLWKSFYASYGAAFNDISKRFKSTVRKLSGDQSGQSSSSKSEDTHSGVSNSEADSMAVPDEEQPPPTPTNASAGMTADTANKSTSSSKPDSDKKRRTKISMHPPLTESESQLSEITMAFYRTLTRTWRSASSPPARGTIVVEGRVELIGPRGYVVLSVLGVYDPKTSDWDRILIDLTHFQKRYQGPIG